MTTKLSDALLALAEPLEESNQWGLRSHTKITPMGEGEIRKLIASLRAFAAQAKELEQDAERWKWFSQSWPKERIRLAALTSPEMLAAIDKERGQ